MFLRKDKNFPGCYYTKDRKTLDKVSYLFKLPKLSRACFWEDGELRHIHPAGKTRIEALEGGISACTGPLFNTAPVNGSKYRSFLKEFHEEVKRLNRRRGLFF